MWCRWRGASIKSCGLPNMVRLSGKTPCFNPVRRNPGRIARGGYWLGHSLQIEGCNDAVSGQTSDEQVRGNRD